MPRGARKKSSSGIYHVIARGINKQKIFQDAEDYEVFLGTIRKYKKVSGYKIFAYCLMNNHIHLLIKEESEAMSKVFRRIGASYVYWYNRKYGRNGHLFQDRYKSEAVEDDSYLLTVMRYVHQNPIKAGIVKELHEYPWSSFSEYAQQKQDLCDLDFPLALFASDRHRALKLWIEYNQARNDDQCLDYDDGRRLNDIEAAEVIKRITQVSTPSEIGSFKTGERNGAIKMMKEQGLSIRQIERLTGITFAIIREL